MVSISGSTANWNLHPNGWPLLSTQRTIFSSEDSTGSNPADRQTGHQKLKCGPYRKFPTMDLIGLVSHKIIHEKGF